MKATVRRPSEWNMARRWALGSYLCASWSWRTWCNWRRSVAGKAPVMVLFYHRIADTHPNDWTASNRTFARHVDWLERNFDVVSLEEAQRRLAAGENRRATVSITFDDGYADNCDSALPLLLRRRLPFTYFVTSRNVLEGLPFPHDVARGLPLEPNTPDQIRRLADAGVEIGCHTRTHADLGRVSQPQQLHEELITAREEIERLTGRPVRYFAFPYGQHENLTSEAFALARGCGFRGVCSAYGGYNFPGDDPFHLQRIHADDDMLRVVNWLTVDPLKLRAAERFVPTPVPCPVLELAS